MLKAAAIDGQRKAFLQMLRAPISTRIQDFLIPKDPTAARAAVDALGRPAGAGLQVSTRVKADIESHAGALMEQHADMLPPNCERAHLHLQMAALALSAQRSLLKEAANGEYESGAESTLAARSVVAGALGVVAPPCGSTPYGAPVMWLPNRTAVLLSWDRQATICRMVDNFKKDLGDAFVLHSLEPPPSVSMKQCLYTDFLRREGEPMLAPVFWALHEATFKGVPGYTFEAGDHLPPDESVVCSFCFGKV